MPRPGEHVPPISADLAKHLIPMCRVRGCEKFQGHEGEHEPVRLIQTTIVKPKPVRKLSRNYLYGKSRADRWPLSVSWLLAPSPGSRQIVRELMQIRKAGGDV